MSVRKGGGAALPPLHSTANIGSEIGKLRLDSKKKGWANGRKCPQRRGGGATLPPLHSTTNIASEIGQLRSNLRKKKEVGEWT